MVAMVHYRRRRAWTETRRDLTHDLVEKMVGYRTRLAQEASEHWHREEDESLGRYLQQSQASDTTQTMLTVLLQRGWFVIGLLGLVPALISATASVGQIAVGVGGVIFIAQVLDWKFIPSFIGLIDAAVVWSQVTPIFHAASRPRDQGSPGSALLLDRANLPVGQPLVELQNVTFRYHPQGQNILDDARVQLYSGDRMLLEGPSGSGKSTFAAVLVGLRSPTSGTLSLRGMDKSTLGAELWRRHLVAAPQFQENHILSETLLFNLLMGRGWPPSQDDVDQARMICRELGLEDLIDRMPGGLFQWVGETGWRLSHGERSRIYIARALLQNADLTVLDESFAALDPENLQHALECALKHARTLLVIAHP